MPICELTEQEQADLAAGVTLGATINLAEQARQLAMSVQRDLLTTVNQCQAMLTAGSQPAVVADLAIKQGAALVALLGKITDEKLSAVQAALLARFGYTPAQSAVIRKVLTAGCQRLQSTAVDGSTIAADVADLLSSFTQPPTLW